MVTTRSSQCAFDVIDELRRYEMCIVNTRQRMMRLCRLVEKAVHEGDIPHDKAERHYLSRIRSANKMAYKYLNLSRQLRNEWFDSGVTRIHPGSAEKMNITRILRMFNTLSDMMFHNIRVMKTNVAFDEN